jgi:hypothetical protein
MSYHPRPFGNYEVHSLKSALETRTGVRACINTDRFATDPQCASPSISPDTCALSRTFGPGRADAARNVPLNQPRIFAAVRFLGRGTISRATGGTSGGTPRDKDEEIRVRMGKFRFQPSLGDNALNGVFTRTCVENKGFVLAPQEQHRSEHGFGEFVETSILHAVNRGARR